MSEVQMSTSGVKDLSMTLGGHIGGLLIALLFQAVLARTLGPAGRGSYDASMLFGALLFLVFNIGAEMSVLYLISSKKVSAVAGISNGFVYVGITSIVAISVGLLVIVFPNHLLEGMYSKASPAILFLGLLAGAATLFAQTAMVINTALKNFRLYSIMMMGERALGLVLIVLFALVLDIGVASALYAIIISKFLVVAISLAINSKSFNPKWESPQIVHLRQLFDYGSRFYGGNLSNQINFRFGPLVLVLFATQEELGFYGQALAVAIYFMVLPDALYLVLLPRASKNALTMVKTIAQAGRIILVYNAIVLLAAHFFANWFFELVLSKLFLPSVPLFKVLILGFAIRAFGKAYEPYLVGTNRPGKVSLAVAAGAVTNIALLFVMMPLLGLEGAAWALVGNYCVSTIIIVSIFMSSAELSFWRSIMPTIDDFYLLKSLGQKKWNGGGG